MHPYLQLEGHSRTLLLQSDEFPSSFYRWCWRFLRLWRILLKVIGNFPLLLLYSQIYIKSNEYYLIISAITRAHRSTAGRIHIVVVQPHVHCLSPEVYWLIYFAFRSILLRFPDCWRLCFLLFLVLVHCCQRSRRNRHRQWLAWSWVWDKMILLQ